MSAPFTLTADQLRTFDSHGLLRLAGFYPRAGIAAMADRLWADLEARCGARRGRPESWAGIPPPAGFATLRRSGAFAALGSPAMMRLADLLLGTGSWERPTHWGRPLVTFPGPAPGLQRPPWHLDLTGAERLDPLPILRIFTFLEPVGPRGGGTLCIAGSHRLAIAIERAGGGPVRSAAVRDRLAADHSWFARLLATPGAALHQRIGDRTTVDGCAVRLEQMTGDPGDLIVMHPAVLHAAAANTGDRPRLMLTEWIARSAAPA